MEARASLEEVEADGEVEAEGLMLALADDEGEMLAEAELLGEVLALGEVEAEGLIEALADDEGEIEAEALELGEVEALGDSEALGETEALALEACKRWDQRNCWDLTRPRD